jgi:GT2 family glycosyltransferase
LSITTIIINYNAGETLQRCVQAVVQSTVRSRIVVADNASTDRSAENLRNLYGDHQGVEFLFNAANLGFGPAINAVAQKAKSDYVLILNPDCILESTALAELEAAMEKDQKAGMAGPAVRDDKGKLQRATVRRFPDPWKSLMTTTGLWRLGKWFPVFVGVEANADVQETMAVDGVSGACMFVRRSALEQAGFMDEKYAMHCEDIDLMYRLAQKGWHCLYVPKAACVHLQGLSSRSRPTWVHYQKHRGMLRFYNQHQAKNNAMPTRALVRTGIWLRFMLLWPLVLLKR